MDLTSQIFVARSGWRLAKTMLDCPHQYTVRDLENPDARNYDRHGIRPVRVVCPALRRTGDTGPVGSRTYRYFRLDGWEYWTMGEPIEVTTIINRRAASTEAERILMDQVAEARRR